MSDRCREAVSRIGSESRREGFVTRGAVALGAAGLFGLIVATWPDATAGEREGSAAELGDDLALAIEGLPEDQITYGDHVMPLLQNYCFACHSNDADEVRGGINLDEFRTEAAIADDRETWWDILDVLSFHDMPPRAEPQPSEAERQLLTTWIENRLSLLDCDEGPTDPGRLTIQRLNRTEYRNTIRDLTGVDFKATDDFPPDNIGFGFDNIGDVLSMSTLLMENYLSAAEQIVEEAIVTDPLRLESPMRRREAAWDLETTAEVGRTRGGRRMERGGEFYLDHEFEEGGRYHIRIRAWANQVGDEPAKMAVRVDGEDVEVLELVDDDGRFSMVRTHEVIAEIEPGERRISAAFVNALAEEELGAYHKEREERERELEARKEAEEEEADDEDRDDEGADEEEEDEWEPEHDYRAMVLTFMEVEGPVADDLLPESHRRIMVAQPAPLEEAGNNEEREAQRLENELEAARQIVTRFARHAFRRPVEEHEVDRLLELVKLAQSRDELFERQVQIALQAVLVSPHFLFRIEYDREPDDPDHPEAGYTISEHELATRLSYFLWSTMPDDELFDLAERGELRDNLEEQVMRMLQDPRATEGLVNNFGGQWLQTRNLRGISPDPSLFPEFNDSLRADMERETLMFFEAIVRDNRSVLDFLDADFTYLNQRLADHYGIEGVEGEQFRLVRLEDPNRGGILTQASVLTITSDPTRTSPVKRGLWMMEQVLGTPPPPAPPAVPDLEDQPEDVLEGVSSLRELLEIHREDPNCAVCHVRMDALGFALENFDAIGRWRDVDDAYGVEVDPSGQLPDGRSFQSPAELKQVLLEDRQQFVENLTAQMLAYGLGRGVGYTDRCAIREIAAEVADNDYRFSSLVLGIINSDLFQKRRGKGSDDE